MCVCVIHYCNVYLPEQPLRVPKLYFLGSVWTLPADGK